MLAKVAYYPGLTAKEKELISRHPKEAVLVFLQKQKAESMSYKYFGRDAEDDESDAFRHFVWAALLYKEIGSDLAKDFLDAHEAGQTGSSKGAMDLANNRAGLLIAEKLVREKRLTQKEIEEEGIKALRDQTLSVLNSRGGPK